MARLLLNDLTPGTAYKIQLRAADGDSFSEWSRRFDLTTTSDTTAPDVPTLPGSPWVVNGDTFVGTWNPLNFTLPQNVDFNHYEVELDDNVKQVVISTVNTSYTLTFDQNRVFFGTPKATVKFRVRSVDNVGNASAWTAQQSATNPAPSNVASISVTALLESIKIDYPAVSDIDVIGYKVQVSTTSSSTGFTDVYNGPDLSVIYGSIQFATDHWFRVYAVDKFGSISSSPVTSGSVRPKSSFTVDTTAPNTPTSLAATITNNANGIGARAAVTWTLSSPPSDLAGFYVRYRKVGDTNWGIATFPSDNTGVSGSFAGTINLDSAYINYEFQIKAFDWSNNESAWSSTVTATSPSAGTPSQVTTVISTPAPGGIIYTWAAVPEKNVNNYVVEVATNSSFTTGLLTFNTGTSTTLSVSGLSQGTTYYMRVKAVNTAGTAGPVSTTDTETTQNVTVTAVSADIITPGTLGTAASGIINLGAGASLVANGGNFRSNTYNGAGNVYDSAATAGFYLGNDGLVIAQGAVKAEALFGGTFTAGTINIGSGGKVQGGSWYLDNTGLFIPDGAIQAAKLLIQNGQNLVPPVYADFEGNAELYSNFPSTSQTIVTLAQGTAILARRNDVPARFGSNHFTAFMGSTNVSNPIVYLGKTTTDYNIPVEAGKAYIFSAYMWCLGAVSTNVELKVKWSTGTISTLTTGSGQVASATLASGGSASSATRLSGYATAPAGATGAVILIESSTLTANAGWSIDGVQAEVKESGEWMPSPWTPGTSTTVVGGQIVTGSIQSSSPALDVNGNPISGVQAWQINTAGNAVFGDALIRGKLIMGISTDYTNSISTGTDADGNTYVYEDTSKLAGIGSIQSYNYLPGVSGWAIRSNGFAEFLQLKANSVSADAIEAVSPDKLNPGTMTADLIIGTAVRSIEKDTLYITQKARVGTVCTLTLASSHTRLIGDRIQVKLDTADSNFDTPGKTFATITAVTDTTISYTSPSGSGTVATTAVTGTVYVEGRSVVMSPDGLTLFQNNGVDRIIDLPTDTLLPAYFAGDVEANSLTVKDDFLLQGLDNAIAAGGVFTLNASIVAPSGTPTFNFSWDYVQTWMTNDFSGWKSGLWFSSGVYTTTNAFFGAGALASGVDGGFAYNFAFADDAGGDGQAPYGAIKANDGKWYLLVNDSTDGLWKVRRYATTGSGFDTLENTWTYDEHSFFGVTATEWKIDGFNGSALKDPVLGYGTPDGTNYYIYIARCNKNGKIVVSRYTTTGTLQANVTTNITDNQRLKSINVGSFDFGGFRWVITTEGNATKNATNYVTNTSGTHQTTETFPAPNNSKTWGMCWNGTNFVTLTQNNRLYTHTAVAKSGTNVWYARSTFFDGDNSRTVSVSAVSGNGTTTTVTTSTSHLFVAGDTVYISGTGATALNNAYYTILTAPTGTTFTVSSSYSGSTGAAGSVTNEWETPMSGYAQSTVTRRAKLTISTSNIPVGAGSNQPDRARFYFRNTAPSSSTDTTNFFRQTNPNPSVSQVFTSSPTFSGTAAVQTAFPAGTPAKIVSNNGLLEISSDGFVRTDRLVLQSTRDANTSAGNTPALMVGTTSGIHLRIDGNEIIAMASDSAQGNLNVNPGGQVNIKDLNVTGSMVGTTTFASATVFNGANNDFPNIPSGGTANANLNTANSNRLRLISSARRFKTNIEPLELNEGHVEKILALEPRIYDRIDDETGDLTPEVGFIAEEAEELGLTPWVIYKDDEIFSFDYFKFSAVAHQGVLRQHHREIVELKAEVAALKARG